MSLRSLLSGDDVDWNESPRHDRNIRLKTERKRELFEPYVTGVDCLDVGSAGGQAGFVDDEYWLHGWLAERASSLVGIDIDEDGVAAARDAGYDVRLASAESFDLDETFDAVVAANVVEHLACPGGLLECARDHLRVDGHLLVTTPRTHTPWNLLRQMKGGIQPHPEHTMWFCRATMEELLDRTGFDLVAYRMWGFDRAGMSPADRAWRAVEKSLAVLPPLSEIEKQQHFFVATPKDPASEGDAD